MIKGTIIGNYRPIACLPLMWKLLTSIFSEAMYGHLSCQELLPNEQKYDEVERADRRLTYNRQSHPEEL